MVLIVFITFFNNFYPHILTLFPQDFYTVIFIFIILFSVIYIKKII